MVELCCGACAELHQFSPIEAQRAVLALYGWFLDRGRELEPDSSDICLKDLLGYPQDQEEYGEYVQLSLETAYEKAGRSFEDAHEAELVSQPSGARR